MYEISLRTNLLVICGMPRTGTSFMGALLNQSSAIEVCNELPDVFEFSALPALIDQYKRWCIEISEKQPWRKITDASIENGVKEIFYSFCRSLKPAISERSNRWDAQKKDSAYLVCIKRPGAEMRIREYENLFENKKPFYTYCIRNPLRIYESIISMPWGVNMAADDFLSRLDKSISAIEYLTSKNPNRVFVFNIEDDLTCFDDRLSMAKRLFEFLGLSMCSNIEKFIVDWKPINRTANQFGDKTFISPEGKLKRLSKLREIYSNNNQLVKRVDRILSLA